MEVEDSKETEEGCEKGQPIQFDFYLGGTITVGEYSTEAVGSRIKAEKSTFTFWPMPSFFVNQTEMQT